MVENFIFGDKRLINVARWFLMDLLCKYKNITQISTRINYHRKINGKKK